MCENCNTTTEDLYYTNDSHVLCEDCFHQMNGFECDDCERTYVNTDYYITHDDRTICERCRDNNYYYCESCDGLFHEDDIHWRDDYAYCNNCYPSNDYIREYHDTDMFMFDGTNPTPLPNTIYMGYELEIEATDRYYQLDTLAEYACNHLEVQCTEDGSINRGFEMVSHPRTLENHLTFNFKEHFDRLIAMGARGDETTTCGLHIHVSRAPLNEDTQDKIILFLENYKEEMCNFARRSNNHYAQFLSDYISGHENPEFVKALEFIKKTKPHTRYMALNTTNHDTIEFRLFKSTLNAETFIATLNMVNNIVKVCNTTPTNEITWEKVINYYRTPQLTSYLERRGILASSSKMVDNSVMYNKYLECKRKEEERAVRLIKNESKRLLTSLNTMIKNNMTIETRRLAMEYTRSYSDVISSVLSLMNTINSGDVKNIKTCLKEYYFSCESQTVNEMFREMMNNVYNSL